MILDESFAALDPEDLRETLGCVLRRAPSLLGIAGHRAPVNGAVEASLSGAGLPAGRSSQPRQPQPLSDLSAPLLSAIAPVIVSNRS